VNRGKIYLSFSFYSVGSHDTTKKQTGGKENGKSISKSTLEVFHMDEERGKAKRIKSLPNLIETADEAAVKEIGEALKTLMKETVSYVTVVSHYRHTIG